MMRRLRQNLKILGGSGDIHARRHPAQGAYTLIFIRLKVVAMQDRHSVGEKMRLVLVGCTLLGLMACSNNSQPVASPSVPPGQPGSISNPNVPGDNSTIRGDAPATRMDRSGSYTK
jgi:hypothetical protein